jgi:hypothetical protein
MTAVATQERLHFAATRDAQAAPEPKRIGMRSRGAGGSKSTTAGVASLWDEEAEESLSEEEEDAGRFFDFALGLDLDFFAFSGDGS